jgi:hypothetical protein
MTFRVGDFVFDRTTGRAMPVFAVSGDIVACSALVGRRYTLRDYHTSELGSVVAEMCRQIDVRDALRAEAQARARQEEISARLERQRARKGGGIDVTAGISRDESR